MIKSVFALLEAFDNSNLSLNNLYFFGGTVRDRLLGVEINDFDVLYTGEKSLDETVEMIKAATGMKPVLKKDEFRFVKFAGKLRNAYTYVVDFQISETVESFLLKRDFTINALAVPFSNGLSFFASPETRRVIDVTSGMMDISRRMLRVCYDDAFKEDPLRILRAAFYAAQYDLTIHPQTIRLLTKDGSYLTKVKKERLVNEFLSLFNRNCIGFLDAICELGLDLVLFGMKLDLEKVRLARAVCSNLKEKYAGSKRKRTLIKVSVLYTVGLHETSLMKDVFSNSQIRAVRRLLRSITS